jgi:WhiB family redox-sensing transcriptional regulator
MAALTDTLTPEEWRASALCAQTDPELFFPEMGDDGYEARQVCRVCPVKAECLEHALEHGEQFGIWGGMGKKKRRKLIQASEVRPEVAAA